MNAVVDRLESNQGATESFDFTELYDTSHWPLVIITSPAEAVSDEYIDASLVYWDEKIMARLKENNTVYGTVLNLTHAAGLSPTQRRNLTAHFKIHEDYNRLHCAGASMVFSSAMLRTLLTAIFWLRKPAHATRVFGKLDDAMEWTQLRIEALKAGARVSDAKDLGNTIPPGAPDSNPAPMLELSGALPTQQDWLLRVGHASPRELATTLANSLQRDGFVPMLQRVEAPTPGWIVQLRYPSHGEASVARSRLESRGLIVNLLSSNEAES